MISNTLTKDGRISLDRTVKSVKLNISWIGQRKNEKHVVCCFLSCKDTPKKKEELWLLPLQPQQAIEIADQIKRLAFEVLQSDMNKSNPENTSAGYIG